MYQGEVLLRGGVVLPAWAFAVIGRTANANNTLTPQTRPNMTALRELRGWSTRGASCSSCYQLAERVDPTQVTSGFLRQLRDHQLAELLGDLVLGGELQDLVQLHDRLLRVTEEPVLIAQQETHRRVVRLLLAALLQVAQAIDERLRVAVELRVVLEDDTPLVRRQHRQAVLDGTGGLVVVAGLEHCLRHQQHQSTVARVIDQSVPPVAQGQVEAAVLEVRLALLSEVNRAIHALRRRRRGALAGRRRGVAARRVIGGVVEGGRRHIAAGIVGEARVTVARQPSAIQAKRRAEAEEEQRPAAIRVRVQAADEGAVGQRFPGNADDASPINADDASSIRHEARRGDDTRRVETRARKLHRTSAHAMEPAAVVPAPVSPAVSAAMSAAVPSAMPGAGAGRSDR